MAGRYAIQFLPSAARQLEKIPANARGGLIDAIDGLAVEPRPDGAKLLTGAGNERIWRIAVSAYRILYTVEDAKLTVLVVRVADRREVYNATTIKRVLKQMRGRPGGA
jgi:mRNA interferase RelE/StbE